MTGLKNTDGVALIMAMFMATFLMIITLDLYGTIQRMYSNTRAMLRSSEAEDISDSMIELAKLEVAKYGFGWEGGGVDSFWNDFNQSGGYSCTNAGGVRTCGERIVIMDPVSYTTEATWQVRARSDAKFTLGTEQLYPVPMAYFEENGDLNGNGLAEPAAPGSNADKVMATGNAAEKCENPLDLNDPCHWNKIEYEEQMEIPLYYDSGNTAFDGDDGIIDPIERDPVHGDFTTFKLRIRTPCQGFNNVPPVTNCSASQRIQLNYGDDPTKKLNINYDITLMPWAIVAETKDPNDGDEGYVTLWRDDNLPNSSKRNAAENTGIYASKINDASNFVILEETDWANDTNYRGRIENFLKAGGTQDIVDTSARSTIWNMRTGPLEPHKPVFYFSLNQMPREEITKHIVPYLEYQVLTNRPIGDTKSLLIGIADVDGFARTTVKSKERKHSVTLPGFALVLF